MNNRVLLLLSKGVSYIGTKLFSFASRRAFTSAAVNDAICIPLVICQIFQRDLHHRCHRQQQHLLLLVL